MPEVSNLFVVLMGIGTVFFGLVCIVFLTSAMSALLKGTEKPAAAPVAAPVSAAPAAADVIPNRQAMIAAISAVIAEEEGTDLTGIRILSVKKL